MDMLFLIVSILCTAAFFIAAFFVYWKAEVSTALVLLVTLFTLLGFGNAFIILMVGAPSLALASLFAKMVIMLIILGLITMLFLIVLFPFHFLYASSGMKQQMFLAAYVGTCIIFGVFSFLIAGAMSIPDGMYWYDENSRFWVISFLSAVMPISAAVDYIAYRTTGAIKKITEMLGLGLIVLLTFVIVYEVIGRGPSGWTFLEIGILISFSIIAMISLDEQINFAIKPASEVLATKEKSGYRLLKGRVYVIEEERPKFAFDLFTEILRSRCYNCTNDQSFICESLDCAKCKLPCPCRECKMYKSRTQGFVITRRHPGEIRLNYLIQTTPVMWLSSLPGKDNMDPAKLNLLTDLVVSFLGKSQNGVVLIEGIEYLMMSNDFQKVLRAVDRWSEVVMSSSARLVLSLDPRAFDVKELALLERNREVIRPDDKASVERILATSST